MTTEIVIEMIGNIIAYNFIYLFFNFIKSLNNLLLFRERSCSRDRSREYKKNRRYEPLHNVEEKHLRERTSRRRYSRSREREQKYVTKYMKYIIFCI